MQWSAVEVDAMDIADIVQWVEEIVDIDREVNEEAERRARSR